MLMAESSALLGDSTTLLDDSVLTKLLEDSFAVGSELEDWVRRLGDCGISVSECRGTGDIRLSWGLPTDVFWGPTSNTCKLWC